MAFVIEIHANLAVHSLSDNSCNYTISPGFRWLYDYYIATTAISAIECRQPFPRDFVADVAKYEDMHFSDEATVSYRRF